MKYKLKSALSAVAVTLMTGTAMAGGELHIFNFNDYIPPDLVAKFEKQYDVKVTIDIYESNETMLSKVRAGGTDYDIVIPGEYAVKMMIEEGLLEKTEPAQMSNFKNVRPEAVDVYWDSGRHYTVPWQFGTAAFAVDIEKYRGDIDTLAILFNPPDELKGRINMLDDMNTVMHAGERYLGIPRCGADKANLKRLNDLLESAKPYWRSFSADLRSKLTSGDVDASQGWNGMIYRARQDRPTLKYSYPREGIEGWMDNLGVLKGAKNLENAKLFQNFMMEPENAAILSAFAGYDNGIKGTLELLPMDIGSSYEFNPPAGAPAPEFVPPCDPEVIAVYNRIWTNLRK